MDQGLRTCYIIFYFFQLSNILVIYLPLVFRFPFMIKFAKSTTTLYTSASLRFNYIRKKNIEDISQGYGETKLQAIKKYSKIFQYVLKEGMKGLRNDITTYRNIKAKNKSQYNHEDWNQLIRIHHDFFRLGPLFIIQILPMSGPLFILYVYTYPGSIPSWFILDRMHEDYEKKIRVVQEQAIDYFRQRKINNGSQIDFNSMNLTEARRLAECLYGYYRDGTEGYNKVLKKNIQYCLSEGFSKYLIKRKLKYKFNADLEHRHILQDKSFDQKIRWKFNQVMVEGILLKKYEDTLTAEELRIRTQQAEAESRMQNQGNKTENSNIGISEGEDQAKK